MYIHLTLECFTTFLRDRLLFYERLIQKVKFKINRVPCKFTVVNSAYVTMEMSVFLP